MGIEWALVDGKNKRLFMLGKGPWPEALLGAHTTKEELVTRVSEAWGKYDHSPEGLSYIARVAGAMWAFMKQAGGAGAVWLANDSDDSLPSLEGEYEVARSRYDIPAWFWMGPLELGVSEVLQDAWESTESEAFVEETASRLGLLVADPAWFLCLCSGYDKEQCFVHTYVVHS
jgi:hypothetical protein